VSHSDPEVCISAYQVLLRNLSTRGPNLQSVWFSAGLKLAQEYILEPSGKHLSMLPDILSDLKSWCKNPDGSDDIIMKGAHLLELYALEIRFLNRMKSTNAMKELKSIMKRCSFLSASISSPRSIGIIREHAGMIFMDDGLYDNAYTEFFEAFKCFSDTGNPKAKAMLKYAVVANLLSLSHIDPFDGREARAFQNDPDISMIWRLRKAYDQWDVSAVDTILEDYELIFSLDPWLTPHMGELLHRIKLKYLERLFSAYRSVPLSSLTRRLNIEENTLTRMCMRLISEGSISAKLTALSLSAADENSDDYLGNDLQLREACAGLKRYVNFLNENLGTVSNNQ
jgi:COP9 signalosome complex subunit 2